MFVLVLFLASLRIPLLGDIPSKLLKTIAVWGLKQVSQNLETKTREMTHRKNMYVWTIFFGVCMSRYAGFGLPIFPFTHPHLPEISACFSWSHSLSSWMSKSDYRLKLLRPYHDQLGISFHWRFHWSLLAT